MMYIQQKRFKQVRQLLDWGKFFANLGVTGLLQDYGFAFSSNTSIYFFK